MIVISWTRSTCHPTRDGYTYHSLRRRCVSCDVLRHILGQVGDVCKMMEDGFHTGQDMHVQDRHTTIIDLLVEGVFTPMVKSRSYPCVNPAPASMSTHLFPFCIQQFFSYHIQCSELFYRLHTHRIDRHTHSRAPTVKCVCHDGWSGTAGA